MEGRLPKASASSEFSPGFGTQRGLRVLEDGGWKEEKDETDVIPTDQTSIQIVNNFLSHFAKISSLIREAYQNAKKLEKKKTIIEQDRRTLLSFTMHELQGIVGSSIIWSYDNHLKLN